MIKTIFSLLAFSSFLITVAGQSNQIMGKVIDQSGKPISYASITFKGTNMFGTWTTVDGTFNTYIPEGADSIVCTHINFSRTSEKITNNNYVVLVLNKKPQAENIITIHAPLKYSKKDAINPVVDEARHFSKVEINASFPGGEKKLEEYFKTSIVYPDSASINNISGIIKIGFTISTDGYSKDIILLKGINKYADEAVIKAVLSMPKWRPALQNGHFVDFYKEISISFSPN